MAFLYWWPGFGLSALYLLYTIGGITQSPLFIRLRGNFIPLYHYFYDLIYFDSLSVIVPAKQVICIYAIFGIKV